MARYSLFVLKVPLNPKHTNIQRQLSTTDTHRTGMASGQITRNSSETNSPDPRTTMSRAYHKLHLQPKSITEVKEALW